MCKYSKKVIRKNQPEQPFPESWIFSLSGGGGGVLDDILMIGDVGKNQRGLPYVAQNSEENIRLLRGGCSG